MKCARCGLDKFGGHYKVPDGKICEDCASDDPKMQYGSLVSLLFQVPYEDLRIEYRQGVDETIARFGFSLEEIQADAKKIDDDYHESCRQDEIKIADMQANGVHDDPDWPFGPNQRVIGD